MHRAPFSSPDQALIVNPSAEEIVETMQAAVAECGSLGPVLLGSPPDAESVCGSRVVIYVVPHDHQVGWGVVRGGGGG